MFTCWGAIKEEKASWLSGPTKTFLVEGKASKDSWAVLPKPENQDSSLEVKHCGKEHVRLRRLKIKRMRCLLELGSEEPGDPAQGTVGLLEQRGHVWSRSEVCIGSRRRLANGVSPGGLCD